MTIFCTKIVRSHQFVQKLLVVMTLFVHIEVVMIFV